MTNLNNKTSSETYPWEADEDAYDVQDYDGRIWTKIFMIRGNIPNGTSSQYKLNLQKGDKNSARLSASWVEGKATSLDLQLILTKDLYDVAERHLREWTYDTGEFRGNLEVTLSAIPVFSEDSFDREKWDAVQCNFTANVGGLTFQHTCDPNGEAFGLVFDLFEDKRLLH